jgi:phospholipase/carboxylesterase
MSAHPPPLVIETAPTPAHACVLLHGGGGAADEFRTLIPAITPPGIKIRYVIPYAPEIPLTLFGKQRMRAWYDVVDANLELHQDTVGIDASLQSVLNWIKHEHAQGIPYERILVGGFSQGGTIALLAALRAPAPLAGAFCLSGYLLRSAMSASTLNQKTPLFIAHGHDDDLVPLRLAQQACADLQRIGLTVAWHAYPMAHQVCNEEVLALRDWLARVCKPSPES